MMSGDELLEKDLQKSSNAAWNASRVGICERLGRAVRRSILCRGVLGFVFDPEA